MTPCSTSTLSTLRSRFQPQPVRHTQPTPLTHHSADDCVHTRNDVGDTSHHNDSVSNRLRSRVHDVPSSNTCRQHQRESKHQGRVERGRGEGEKGRRSKGKDDEKAAAATGPGKGAMDHRADGVSLVKPTSSFSIFRVTLGLPKDASGSFYAFRAILGFPMLSGNAQGCLWGIDGMFFLYFSGKFGISHAICSHHWECPMLFSAYMGS
jgi:hypothetical protein